MKITVDYQHMPKGSARPLDNGAVVDICLEDIGGHFGLIPNVGDYVQVIAAQPGDPAFSGKVRSRLFTHFGQDHLHVNLVVEDDDDDWGKLIKE